MSHHATYADTHRVMGSRAGRMLKGEKPATRQSSRPTAWGKSAKRCGLPPTAWHICYVLLQEMDFVTDR
jgi:hypothetical protein